MRTNIFGDPVKTDSKWTTTEMAQMLQVKEEQVRNMKQKLCIKIEIEKTHSGRRALYDYEAYMKMKNYLDVYRQRLAAGIKTPPSIEDDEEKERNLAEMRAEHPLVIDERCFNFNWWPDTTPICFQEVLDD